MHALLFAQAVEITKIQAPIAILGPSVSSSGTLASPLGRQLYYSAFSGVWNITCLNASVDKDHIYPLSSPDFWAQKKKSV